MENEPIKTPIQPEIQTETVSAPVNPIPSTIPKKGISLRTGIIVIIILLIISIIVGYFVSKGFYSNEQTSENPIVNITPTTSVNTTINPIATSSAFLQMETSIASLSSRLSGFNPIDSQIVPPVLDLPLGFSK